MSDRTKPSVKTYVEPEIAVDFAAFAAVVESRRSVRKYLSEPIPEAVVQRCLDLALLAPTSSNMQSWQFIRVTDPQRKAQLAEACLSQPAATTAAELIVAVARTDTWRKHSRQILQQFEDSVYEWPTLMKRYYQLGTHLAYGLGPLGLNGTGKRVVQSLTSPLRSSPSSPYSRADLKLWAVKTTALACENLMLAFRAAGYDTCPMEGYDERRVRRLVGLRSRHEHLVMVISAGKRAPKGVYGPRLRLPREQFIREI